MNFETRDMKAAQRFLGIKITRDRQQGTIFISQHRYIEKVAKKFGIEQAFGAQIPMAADMVFDLCAEGEHKGNVPYRELVICLLYAAVTAPPDIMFAIAKLARFSTIATNTHWKGLNNVLRYLIHTKDMGLQYGTKKNAMS